MPQISKMGTVMHVLVAITLVVTVKEAGMLK